MKNRNHWRQVQLNEDGLILLKASDILRERFEDALIPSMHVDFGNEIPLSEMLRLCADKLADCQREASR